MKAVLKRSYLRTFAFAKAWGFVKTPTPEAILKTVTDAKKVLGDALFIGGIAVGHHGHERTTEDVDILYPNYSEHEFLRALQKDFKIVIKAESGWHQLEHRKTKVRVELIPEGGLGTYGFIPGPKTVGGKDGFISLLGLAWLKLVSARSQDIADLVNLAQKQMRGMHALTAKLPPELRERFQAVLTQAQFEMDNDPLRRAKKERDAGSAQEPSPRYGKKVKRAVKKSAPRARKQRVR